MNFNEFKIKAKRRLLAYWYKANRNKFATDGLKILFFTFQGKYTCNPKYICRHLHRKRGDLRCVWVIFSESERADFPEYAETVLFGTPEYYRALYSSKILVDNGFNFVKQPMEKKKGQYYIETMHGSLGIKRIDAADSAIRVSFNADNTSEEIDALTDAVAQGIASLAHFH